MSDLINNPVINNTSSTPKLTGPREDQTTQASEAQVSSPAQETQPLKANFATIVYNSERQSSNGFMSQSRNDKTINKVWTSNTNAVAA